MRSMSGGLNLRAVLAECFRWFGAMRSGSGSVSDNAERGGPVYAGKRDDLLAR